MTVFSLAACRLRSRRGVHLLGLAVALSALGAGQGCKGYYIAPAEATALADRASIDPSKSLGVSFEFQRDGDAMDAVTEKHRGDVLSVLDESGLFLSVDTASSPDLFLDVEINNLVDGVGGAMMAGFFSGLTLGLIGTRVTDEYDVTITLSGPDAADDTLTYDWELISTSGLIKSSPDTEKYGSLDEAFSAMVRGVLTRYLRDMQDAGRL